LTLQIAIESVLQLLHETSLGVLSTHSTQLPGFPYGTAVPLILDHEHRPILLISALAEHTRNLLADARASLAVVEGNQRNVQDAARVTLVGRFEPFVPDAPLVDRYLRYQPAAEQYLQLDFSFFRLAIERARYIGGVGKMGWLDKEGWRDLVRLSPDEEATLLAATKELPKGIRLLGIDAYGLDYEAAGIQCRKPFAGPLHYPALAGILREVVAQLA